MKAHYGDIGIVNIISYKAGWLSEINNDARKDANQGNKMRTYLLFKTIEIKNVKTTCIRPPIHDTE